MRSRNNRATLFAAAVAGFFFTQASMAETASPERLEEVTERGRHIMPFSLEQTRHIFTKTDAGGVQQVIARDPANHELIELIRQHLSKIADEFGRGDFSNPAKIHGEEMPGLAQLRQAKPKNLQVQYRVLPNGAEITYSSQRPALIDAVHQWFDAQLRDHGPDAVPSLHHEGMHMLHDMDRN